MTVVFDGREFAKFRQVALGIKVYELLGNGVRPRLASILVGTDPASRIYTSLKVKKAKEIKAEMDIYEVGTRKGADYILRLIRYLNTKEDVHGIMVQLPLPERLKRYTSEIINTIDPKKDVDGLKSDSPYLHPTAMAVLEILREAKKLFGREAKRNLTKNVPKPRKNRETIYVVGATGMVGRPLVKELKKLGYKLVELDEKTKNLKRLRRANYIISATGVNYLITADYIKPDSQVVIDVGSPKGDVDFEKVKEKTQFITPVPGGVGPVTIICLLENLVKAAYNSTITHT